MVLDTNILIGCLEREPNIVPVVNTWKQEQRTLVVSSISVTEILALPSLSSHDIKTIRAFLKNFFIVSFDNHLAEIAAYFRREYRLTLPDAGIAATAIQSELPLVTRDKAFRKITELKIIAL